MFRDQRMRQVAYVPDFGHARLIELVRADRQMRAVPLTTEEEGVALATTAKAPLILPPREGNVLKNRFREALLGDKTNE